MVNRLASQVIQYNIKPDITHQEYLKIVDHNPILQRELRQDFDNRWAKLVNMMLAQHPHVYKHAAEAHKPAPAPAPAPAPKAAPKPKAAPAKPATAPKPKAAPKKES